MSQRFLFSALLVFLTAAGAQAQTADSVRGRLVDQEGKPLSGQRVVLHRVVGESGANIAETRTTDDGRFVVAVDSADNPAAAYFLAARWEGELYIGEAFRAPFGTREHLLQVGVPGTSASALIDGTSTSGMPQAMPPAPATGSPATRTSWLLFAVPAISLLGVAVFFLLRGRTGVPERRRLLAEVAELDLQHAGAPSEEYRVRRAALLERLRDAST